MRSETFITMSMLCSTSNTAWSRDTSAIRSMMSSTLSLETPALGSSSNSTSGSPARAIPTSSWRFSPWESALAGCSASVSRPTRSRIRWASPMCSSKALALRHPFQSFGPAACAATRTFSSTVRSGNTFVIW
ncbi:hypothetical protein SY89_02751 [Halolamina pelagica]|uniref:Uncharacterized protein n=1 Tax=Halolamina pelagica TaxID=699431 RepID=A0A0P7HXZ2_9EURY|nr:hypothetical protein SY89_02751 [Halolamina pelagica]